jgi:hypothetical protein
MVISGGGVGSPAPTMLPDKRNPTVKIKLMDRHNHTLLDDVLNSRFAFITIVPLSSFRCQSP